MGKLTLAKAKAVAKKIYFCDITGTSRNRYKLHFKPFDDEEGDYSDREQIFEDWTKQEVIEYFTKAEEDRIAEEKEWKEFPSDWSVEKWEAFKSDLEDAGAIVETKRECPYCFTYNDERLPFVDEKGWVIRLWNNGGKWNLDINMEKHEFDEVIELPALYCLKCGRKLET